MWDNDGEFLLIEAAYSLPRWLRPEAAANRVGGWAGGRAGSWSAHGTARQKPSLLHLRQQALGSRPLWPEKAPNPRQALFPSPSGCLCMQVWLHGGALHIVPPPRLAGDPLLPVRPTAAQAVALVRGAEVDTRAGPAVQAAIQQRLEGTIARGQAVQWESL